MSENTEQKSLLGILIRFFLEQKLIVFLLLIGLSVWGIAVAPFDWDIDWLPRDPVGVDAIPDIGANQQIVFTAWPGRSPQDIEDQVTYPLTTTLLGIPGVETVRSFSMFGFSSIYLIFEDEVDFYWSRSRILEKLNSLPPGTLPDGARPALGPDATALGQVFWYTLEGRDAEGNPAGGWDLDELRSVQDWQVRYALQSVKGVSEVASVGGHVREYQVDVDPAALRAFGVTLDQVFNAVRMSNRDVGARTIEVNNVEYVIRGIGFIKTISDIENAVITQRENAPVLVKHVASVGLGPATRRGILDKEGAEAVGGVVVVRYGENPLETIERIKHKIVEISPGLPERELADGTVSKVSIVPFYDRTGLINETLGTLNTALSQEILVTILVILVMVLHLRSSVLISGMLPLAVLICFIAMRLFGVDANIVALSGIAIAIGTIVDMGIVVTENILLRLRQEPEHENKLEVVFDATREVGGAVLTAVATTVVSFLPVFTMEGAEGKLFKPLAFTKTYALIASILIALFILPAVAHLLFTLKIKRALMRIVVGLLLFIGAVWVMVSGWGFAGVLILAGVVWVFLTPWLSGRVADIGRYVFMGVIGLWIAGLLAADWTPLGPEKGLLINAGFVIVLVGGLLFAILLFLKIYPTLLDYALRFKAVFLVLPLLIILWGGLVWFGFHPLFGWLPESFRRTAPVTAFARLFPGLGKEFMPPLDEGAYLYMPTTMPHASVGEAIDVIQKQDKALAAIPEVASAVGKLGRAETPLDPAPLSMIETIINYHPEFLEDESGRRLSFRWTSDEDDFFRNPEGEPVDAIDGEPYVVSGKFIRDENNDLIPEAGGKPFRLWRPVLDPELNPERKAWDGINEPDDIWDRIVAVTKIPGTTSAPRLQPISARLVMLQSGMRAPMGMKIRGPDLETIEEVGLQIERLIKEVPSVYAEAVNADRIVGKPYIEIVPDQRALARHGVMIEAVQRVIEVSIGGIPVTMTVEGRERYAVRVRYKRELRDEIDSLGDILVAASGDEQIPLRQLADIRYVRGPQVIKSEDTFLTGYVLFDKKEGFAEVDVVEHCQRYLDQAREDGRFIVPEGVSYVFAGNYQNQLRAQKRLRVVLPMALLIIFIILYFQFHRVSTTLMVFSGILVAWAGGFIMIWFYAQPWFLNFSILGVNMAELLQIHTINLSVAVWVGFLALFGIASDGGVIVADRIRQNFDIRKPQSIEEIREEVHAAGVRRARPLLMTTATTVLALIPILTSSGRGADIMVPMAIPTFGGMSVAVITMFVVPVLYAMFEELRLRFTRS